LLVIPDVRSPHNRSESGGLTGPDEKKAQFYEFNQLAPVACTLMFTVVAGFEI
jgi:hypothetical protein